MTFRLLPLSRPHPRLVLLAALMALAASAGADQTTTQIEISHEGMNWRVGGREHSDQNPVTLGHISGFDSSWGTLTSIDYDWEFVYYADAHVHVNTDSATPDWKEEGSFFFSVDPNFVSELDHGAFELFGHAFESLPFSLSKGHDDLHLVYNPAPTSGSGILTDRATLVSFYDREIGCFLDGRVTFYPVESTLILLSFEAYGRTDLTLRLTYNYQPVPEPSTWAAIGLPSVLLLRRRRHSVDRGGPSPSEPRSWD